MTARALGPATAVLVGGLAAAGALLFSNVDRALVLDVYLVYLGGVSLHALGRATGAAARRAGPSAFEAALRQAPRARSHPERLVRLEGLVSLASATAGDFHHGLRQPLREAAAHALESRHAIGLDADPGRVDEILGSEARRLLAGERPPPADRFAPGPATAALARTVSAIERIAP